MSAKPARPKQLNLAIRPRFSHGGRRPGAGRKRRTELQSHIKRPRIQGHEPVHVTLKLQEGLPSLRRKDVFRCLRDAVKKARTRGFIVAHFAILSNHVHLILEPRSTKLLGKWIQSLALSLARRINSLTHRRGAVFEDRYHLHILRTPTETRRALAYVLTNESRHELTRAGRAPRRTQHLRVTLDPYSSAHVFTGWDKLLDGRIQFEFSHWTLDWIEAWHREILAPPRTWLLAQGWHRGRA